MPGDVLLRLKGIWREYPAGDQTIAALKNLDLEIAAGEFVAIMGQSGSGKSTLMNLLGCLDRPTRGLYEVAGHDASALSPDELAALRRQHFGFIFQRYHLLADLDASANVEVPAIYAGWSGSRRRQRATALLGRLGLGDRLGHRPNQLSGGQQQRVSVARALMNGGEIILADEPTGALDSRSGEEMLRLLEELNAEGHTIILVTHDAHVAEHARRVVELKDGEVIADRQTARRDQAAKVRRLSPIDAKESWTAYADRLGDALRMALLAMNAHKLRSFLTMLGIIIGIASVVSIMAVGAGAQKAILGQISELGVNTVMVFPGRETGDVRATAVTSLSRDDMDAVSRQSYVDSVTTTIDSGATLRRGAIQGAGRVTGVSEQYAQVNALKLAKGAFFSRQSIENAEADVVLDDNAAKKLFPDGANPLGQIILIGALPGRVVGVMAPNKNGLFGGGNGLQVWIPYTALNARVAPQRDGLRNITVRLADGVSANVAQKGIGRVLSTRHGKTDFFMQSTESIRNTINRVTGQLSLMIGAIGGISLVVGGIGVMNIMLVSVSERTHEIGVRTAIGARRSDILAQFIIEAVLVCLIGGGLGLGLSMLIGAVFHQFVKDFELIYSTSSILTAFGTACMIGLVFGWLPARNASRLDPVRALARE